jgi:amino acid transporter
MVLNFILTCTYILIGNFGSLVTFIGITEYTGYLFTLSGLVYMRYSRPDLYRPYKPPLWTPLVFIAFCLVLVVRGVIFAPVQACALVAYVAGVCVYYWVFWVPRRASIR